MGRPERLEHRERTVDPLIVSALLDEDTQDTLDALRRRLFPANRRVVGAHLTMFHELPGERVDAILDDLREAARRPPIDARVGRPFLMGRGVGYPVRTTELEQLREGLARRWWPDLGAQDRRRWSAHVTVQNKVEPDEARRTLAELEAEHRPYPATVRGLALWHYRGGPWESVAECPFG